MNKIIISKKEIEKVKNNDPHFGRELSKNFEEFKSILRQAPAYMKLLYDTMNKGDKYVAVLPKDVLAGLKNGTLEKLYNKDSGLWTGMIRRVDNKREIVKQANWMEQGINKSELFSNLNNISMQISIAEITEMMYKIDKKINLILDGQHEDRIAEIKAGINLYNKAISETNDNTAYQIHIANSLQNLETGREKLIENLQSKLNYKIREKENIDKIWWKILKIDRPLNELVRYLKENEENIFESAKYINLSSAYIYKIHVLNSNIKSAKESKSQYLDFSRKLLESIADKKEYMSYNIGSDYNLDDFEKDFLSLNQIHGHSVENQSMEIELTYREVEDAAMSVMQ